MTRERSRAIHWAAMAIMAACGVLPSGHAMGQASQGLGALNDFARGRILVMPRSGLSAAELDKIVKVHGGKARRIGQSNLYIVDLPASASETAVVEQLARNPHLKFAELDHKVPPALAANDPYVGSEWQLPKVKADLAWDQSMGSGVTIAILDSGVLPTHQDLIANLVPGWNAYDGSAATSDVTGHGTAVAGAAAASTNNATGVAGVAGLAKIMPIRITDSSGNAYYSTIASGITYAADHGVRVVNCSYGYLFKTSSIQSAGSYLKNKGGLLVVSAGNNGIDENSPATTTMITVSATDGNDALASWSSYGSMVSVAAPGVGIWTTSNDGTYRSASGTSFSAPVTAGVVALIMSANPSLSSGQVEQILFSTAADLGAAGKDIYYGYGRIDANAAVLSAKSGVASDTTPPSVAINSPAGGSTVSGLVQVDVGATDNVGVTKVELRVNGSLQASDGVGPYQFSWDTTKLSNGSASLTATAYDAAGNSSPSAAVSVYVVNDTVVDTTPPVVAISNPASGSSIAGNVSVQVSASDNVDTAGIATTLYIDGKPVANGTGNKMSYNWNTRKVTKGQHTLSAVATDTAGNRSTTSIQVSK